MVISRQAVQAMKPVLGSSPASFSAPTEPFVPVATSAAHAKQPNQDRVASARSPNDHPYSSTAFSNSIPLLLSSRNSFSRCSPASSSHSLPSSSDPCYCDDSIELIDMSATQTRTIANTRDQQSLMRSIETHRSADHSSRRPDPRMQASSSASNERMRIVKVAQDMHNGALPPIYKRDASDHNLPRHANIPAALLSTESHCTSCGAKVLPGNGCLRCGKRMPSGPLTPSQSQRPSNQMRAASERVYPPTSFPTQYHQRAVSENNTTTYSTAGAVGPSNMAGQPRKPCCSSCGRKARADTSVIPEIMLTSADAVPPGPLSAPLPDRTRERPAMSTVYTQPAQPTAARVDVAPTIASTSSSSPSTKPERKPSLFRGNSIRRAFSKLSLRGTKNKSKPAPLPLQQTAAVSPTIAQQSPSYAGRPSLTVEYRMDPRRSVEGDDRPISPFSFTEGVDESEVFDARSNPIPSPRNKNRQGDYFSGHPVAQNATINPIEFNQTYTNDPERIQQLQQVESQAGLLAVPGLETAPANKPPLTRFRSLRGGVTRMASVSRSTSLKRLGSLKTVHHAWYRDDMALEGANAECVIVY